MFSLACEKETEIEWGKQSDEKIVEGYVIAILNKCDQNLKFLEQELFKRKLFLVALEQYDIKKHFIEENCEGFHL
ncbi:hypothetical protein [Neobacillus niacini]|uniref:hypothetical protein n=1 Tax=Neobacillus niacini TaxID=86668 RepID=UPI00285BB5C0|nr:hypothetical protein [Neobacillus niacini]MDR7002743.1 hypothetical protein [Neobacillus niacini]